jgi:hypothetical protein
VERRTYTATRTGPPAAVAVTVGWWARRPRRFGAAGLSAGAASVLVMR